VRISMDDLAGRVGQELALSSWLEVTQEQIDRFAEATLDRQWIHVDPDRARASAWGGTVAHGFLTLSLLPFLVDQAVAVEGARSSVNYGLDRLRFPAPVPAGARVRARVKLAAFSRVEGGIQVTWEVTVEREGAERPCLVASWLRRYLG